MFTVEHEEESSVVTILSEEPLIEDVQVHFDGEFVWIQQYEDDEQRVVVLTRTMWLDLFASFNSPAGAFKLVF